MFKALLSLAGVLLVSIQAHSVCYERLYSKQHLAKYKNQELQSVHFTWATESQRVATGDPKEPWRWEVRYPFTVTMHTKQSGANKVGKAKGYCDKEPHFSIWWGDEKLPHTVVCKIEGTNETIELRPYSKMSALGVMSSETALEDITMGATPGSKLKIPTGDLKFGLNERTNLGPNNCEEPVGMVHAVTLPRLWSEVVLFSIRNDLARPTVTARNLYHLSQLMWDVYKKLENDPETRDKAMSYAAYVFIKERYKNAPGNVSDLLPDGEFGDDKPDLLINNMLDGVMKRLGLESDVSKVTTSTNGYLGVKMAKDWIAANVNDGSRESENYAAIPGELKNPNKDKFLDYTNSGIQLPYDYEEVNGEWQWVGGGDIVDQLAINYWIPLFVPGAADQGGNEQESRQAPLTLFWGGVPTFADLEAFKSPDKPGVYFDPGKYLPTFEGDRDDFIRQNLQVLEFSALLNPIDVEKDGKDFDRDGKPDVNPGMEMIDISPRSFGNNTLGTNDGKGRAVNPMTEKPYEPHMVKKADFYRSIAEFWADGPHSETPPGHWNTLANYTIDRQVELGQGLKWKGEQELSREEYELRTYLTLNGALHDAAVVAWGIKGYYEGNRPISVLRKFADMAEKDPAFANELMTYSDNIKMVDYIADVQVMNEYGEYVSSYKEPRRKMVFNAWRGHSYVGTEAPGSDRRDQTFQDRDDISQGEFEYYNWDKGANGVGWILADNWMPYQQQNFVTPPFPGFVSGHSTFSRAAAEVLAYTTGSAFFPGGLGTYKAPDLVFEESFESKGFEFQWATFFDASDQSGISRLYGGIHASYDDLPAREIGSKVGKAATQKAEQIFSK